jgi:hypothetical protein
VVQGSAASAEENASAAGELMSHAESLRHMVGALEAVVYGAARGHAAAGGEQQAGDDQQAGEHESGDESRGPTPGYGSDRPLRARQGRAAGAHAQLSHAGSPADGRANGNSGAHRQGERPDPGTERADGAEPGGQQGSLAERISRLDDRDFEQIR